MTRPRISGSEVSWQVVLAVAMKAMLVMPSSTMRASSVISVGAKALATMTTPKAMQLPTSSLAVGRSRDATPRAPTMEPTPMSEVEPPVGAGVAVEGELGQHRQDHGEVEGERARLPP